MYDLGVVHFDFYAMAGAGQMALESGSSTATTAGAGFAFWFSQHLTSKLEVRWLGYEAERVPGKTEDMNLTVGALSVGYLL
jgi:opacity protein-like surface antigen